MATNVMARRVSVVGRNSQMNSTETKAMINSLSYLQNYYQSRYEHYLAMATEAKKHRERVFLLLQDLLAHSGDEETYLMEKPQNNESIKVKSLDNGKRSPLWSSASPTKLSSDHPDPVVDEDS
jgi:hypothetical protein